MLPQASSRNQALLAGEVDYVNFSALASNDYVQFDGIPAFTLIPNPAPAVEILQVNTRKPEFSDPKGRQAMRHAIDRQRLHDSAFNGLGAVGTMPSRPGWLGRAMPRPISTGSIPMMSKRPRRCAKRPA